MTALDAIVVLPLAGALVCTLIPARFAAARATVAALACAASLAIALTLFAGHHPRIDDPATQWISAPSRPLLTAWAVRWAPAADGVALLLAALFAGLGFVVALFPRERRERFEPLVLGALGAALAAVLSTDLFVFLAASDVALALLLVAVATSRAEAAGAVRRACVWHALFALPLWFVAFHLHWLGGGAGFDLQRLVAAAIDLAPSDRQVLAFAMVAGLGGRIGLVPAHRWSTELAAASPPTVATLLFPFGSYLAAYGIWRFAFPLFPDASAALGPPAGWFAAIGLAYLGFLAYTDEDPVRMFAHICTALGSLMVVGLVSLSRPAVAGAMVLMLSQGLVMGALFLVLAALSARGHWSLATVATEMPQLTTMAAIGILALAGIPGTAGFVAQVLTLAGAFDELPGLTFVGALGLAPITVALIALQRRAAPDAAPPVAYVRLAKRTMSWRETVPITILLLAVLVLGIAPGIVLDRINPAIDRYCEEVRHRRLVALERGRPVRGVEDPFHTDASAEKPTPPAGSK